MKLSTIKDKQHNFIKTLNKYLIMPYYEEIEWELLQKERIFEDFEWTFELPFEMMHIKKLKIYRDDFYNISLKIKCVVDENFFKEIGPLVMIKFIKIKSKFCSDEYLIEYLDVLKYTSFYENSSIFLNISLSATKIMFNPNVNENIAWIKEWYLNGPSSKIIFPRTTEFSKKEIYEKELYNPPQELNDGSKFKIETNKIGSTSHNYIFCKLNDAENIIIGRVPDEMAPDWSNNISISYNSEKYVNNTNIRGNIENIVSFVFGKKLIKVAESYYDSKGNKIKEKIYNPFIDQKINIKNICKSNGKFPIPIHRYHREDVELVISDLINSFIENKVDFSQMFVNYWASSFLPPESKIMLLAASLESLKNKWFKSENSKSRGVIIDKPLFRILIKDIKNSFNLIFGECDQIKDNFGGLNMLSINKGFETFFEEIGIDFGEVELGAIRARNNPVHGNDIDSETYRELIIYAEVYQVLVNRVILTLLDFDGLYNIHDFVDPVQILEKIPYSLEELRDDVYQLKTYDVD